MLITYSSYLILHFLNASACFLLTIRVSFASFFLFVSCMSRPNEIFYKPTIVGDFARISSVSSLMSNIVARARGRSSINSPISLVKPENTSFADIPWPMRTDWGGHDPASPFAELIINTHSMIWPMAIFIFCSAAYMVKK